MATDLNTLVEQLKRECAVPGNFAANYPQTQTSDLVGSLEDAVGRAQLIGFLTTSVLDLSTHAVEPDLSPAAKGLVVLFAADSIITMRLLELNQRSLYEAGPVKYETEKAASVLTEILKTVRARRQEILDAATGVGRTAGGFEMVDQYADRIHFYSHEVR